MRNDKEKPDRRHTAEDKDLLLREEDLDIGKSRHQTGEVSLGKEIVEERQDVDVPVEHEEVVIERNPINHAQSSTPIGEEETFHIPVSEEQVHVGKHTEVVGEVEAHKQEVEETAHVDETLKHEEARLREEGTTNLVDDDEDEEDGYGSH